MTGEDKDLALLRDHLASLRGSIAQAGTIGAEPLKEVLGEGVSAAVRLITVLDARGLSAEARDLLGTTASHDLPPRAAEVWRAVAAEIHGRVTGRAGSVYSGTLPSIPPAVTRGVPEVVPASPAAPVAPPRTVSSAARPQRKVGSTQGGGRGLVVAGVVGALVALGVAAALVASSGKGDDAVAISASTTSPRADTSITTSEPAGTVATTLPSPTPTRFAGSSSVAVSADVDGGDLPRLVETFTIYIEAINSGDLALAYQQLSGPAQDRSSFDDFVLGARSSQFREFEIRGVQPEGSDATVVRAAFRTTQDAAYGPDGQPCSRWEMDYRMRLTAGTWRIDRATPLNGTPLPC